MLSGRGEGSLLLRCRVECCSRGASLASEALVKLETADRGNASAPVSEAVLAHCLVRVMAEKRRASAYTRIQTHTRASRNCVARDARSWYECVDAESRSKNPQTIYVAVKLARATALLPPFRAARALPAGETGCCHGTSHTEQVLGSPVVAVTGSRTTVVL